MFFLLLSIVCFDSDSICATALSKMEAQEAAIDYRMANSKCERNSSWMETVELSSNLNSFCTHTFGCELIRSFEIAFKHSD